MSLVGKKTPYFTTGAVLNGREITLNFSLFQYLDKQNVLLFFYPKDFTAACAREMQGFQQKLKEFEKNETVIIGCSTDTEESHLAWLDIPKDLGGIAGITFPIIADPTKTIALNYGVLGGGYTLYDDSRKWTFAGSPYAYSATFLIDKKGIVRHQSVNDLSLGRNIDEYIRLIDAQMAVEGLAKTTVPNKQSDGKSATETEPAPEYFSNN